MGVPRGVLALVSVDDFAAAVRRYVDRVYDLLRRSGVDADTAAEVCEREALALLDTTVKRPEVVGDLAGWWFGRALDIVGSAGDAVGARQAPDAGPEETTSLLSGTQGEGQIRAALATLREDERAAVTLRDAYDLPAPAVAVALGRDREDALMLVACGRLHLVAAYDDIAPADLSGHTGRTTVDLPTLSQVADGSLRSPRAAPVRRHAQHCDACEGVVDALEKGRRLATGLPILAMAEQTRTDLLDRLGAHAANALPSQEALERLLDEERDAGPAISPIVVIVAIAIALTLGIVVAILTHAS
jgi:hypothetical protein